MEPKNVTFLVSLAFMMAGSTQFPLFFLTLYWRKLTASGAVAGMITGLLASLWLVLPGGTELENPGILAIPLCFAAAVIGTWLTRRPEEEQRSTGSCYGYMRESIPGKAGIVGMEEVTILLLQRIALLLLCAFLLTRIPSFRSLLDGRST